MLLDILMVLESNAGYLILIFLSCTYMVNTLSIGGLLVMLSTSQTFYFVFKVLKANAGLVHVRYRLCTVFCAVQFLMVCFPLIESSCET